MQSFAVPLMSLTPLCPCVFNGVSPLARGRKTVVTFLCAVYLSMVGIPPPHLFVPPQENTSAIICSSGGRMNDNCIPISCLIFFMMFLSLLCSQNVLFSVALLTADAISAKACTCGK